MTILEQLQALPQQWERIARDTLGPMRQQVQNVLMRARNPINSSYELALKLMSQSKFDEAKYRLKFVLWRRPNFAEAWYRLALCEMRLGNQFQGIEALNKSLALDEKSEKALFLKAVFDEGKYANGVAPHTTPPEFIASEFDVISDYYDVKELKKGYQAAQIITEILNEYDIILNTILDAGCGTGICGGLPAKYSIGVDLSKNMLLQINRFPTTLYDETIHADIRDYLLLTKTPKFNFITAFNVANIMGGLTALFDGVAKTLSPQGYFLLTASISTHKENYHFNGQTHRFAHSRQYLENQAERSGLTICFLKEMPLYSQDETPYFVMLLQK